MIIGVDVSKDSLVYSACDGHASSIANSPESIQDFLTRLAPGTIVAMEATGRLPQSTCRCSLLGGIYRLCIQS